MQDSDRRELLCQLPPGTTSTDAAAACYHATQAQWQWVASYRGTPACAAGYMALTHTTWAVWAFGTHRMRRVMPRFGRFLLSKAPDLIAAGCRRVEARPMKDNTGPMRWIASLGGTLVCALPDAGNDGEDFELWCWMRTDVLHPESPQDAQSRPGSVAR